MLNNVKRFLLSAAFSLVAVSAGAQTSRTVPQPQPAIMSTTPTTNPILLQVLDNLGNQIQIGSFAPGGAFTAIGSALRIGDPVSGCATAGYNLFNNAGSLGCQPPGTGGGITGVGPGVASALAAPFKTNTGVAGYPANGMWDVTSPSIGFKGNAIVPIASGQTQFIVSTATTSGNVLHVVASVPYWAG